MDHVGDGGGHAMPILTEVVANSPETATQCLRWRQDVDGCDAGRPQVGRGHVAPCCEGGGLLMNVGKEQYFGRTKVQRRRPS